MKILSHSLSLAKSCAVAVATFSMVIAPVAQGANAKAVAQVAAKPKVMKPSDHYNFNMTKSKMLEYLKFSGLSGKKRITVGEFWSKMRPYYPKTLQKGMDRWVMLNRNDFMPQFEATTYKDSEGKEHIRLLISKDGQTVTASFNPESNSKFVKVNNTYLTRNDMLYHDQALAKVAHGDKGIKNQLLKAQKKPLKKSVVLSFAEFNRLAPKQKAEYMVRLRYVAENAERVKKVFGAVKTSENETSKEEFFVQWFLGVEAEAADRVRGAGIGDGCIVNGFLSQYGENFSCGGRTTGREHLETQIEKYSAKGCSSGTLPCNPYVYGFKTGGTPGRPYCVSTANVSGSIRDATSKFCPGQSPLGKGTPNEAADKKRIIESWMAAKGQPIDLAFDKDGKVSKEQYDKVKEYVDGLNAYIDEATLACATLPLSATKAVRDEQESACTALATRKMDLAYYPTTPPIIPPPPIGEEKDCSTIKAGALPPECVTCPPGMQDGTLTEDGGPRPACVDQIANTGAGTKEECNKDEKRDEKSGECEPLCGWWCKYGNWVIGGAVIAGIIGAIAWLTGDDDDDDDDNKQTPYDPCPPEPQVCTPGVTPPVTTPPVTTEPPPPTTNPPVDVIPTPVPTPFEESTTGTSTSTSGGAR
ncbi:hypothetical protein [Bdellovibrio sp. HCB337]|uniref:hypothetical protein n=1 Tax=Bdellovibrio sp. HCB337 TaxID=3394358 RepID=UPI0039A50893